MKKKRRENSQQTPKNFLYSYKYYAYCLKFLIVTLLIKTITSFQSKECLFISAIALISTSAKKK